MTTIMYSALFSFAFLYFTLHSILHVRVNLLVLVRQASLTLGCVKSFARATATVRCGSMRCDH